MKNKKRIGDENHGKQRKKELGMKIMENKEKKNSIVKRMIFAVVAGFVVGFLSLFLREFLNGHGNGNVWNIINAIFFQDITTTDGFEGLGLFYIIG